MISSAVLGHHSLEGGVDVRGHFYWPTSLTEYLHPTLLGELALVKTYLVQYINLGPPARSWLSPPLQSPLQVQTEPTNTLHRGLNKNTELCPRM